MLTDEELLNEFHTAVGALAVERGMSILPLNDMLRVGLRAVAQAAGEQKGKQTIQITVYSSEDPRLLAESVSESLNKIAVVL